MAATCDELTHQFAPHARASAGYHGQLFNETVHNYPRIDDLLFQ